MVTVFSREGNFIIRRRKTIISVYTLLYTLTEMDAKEEEKERRQGKKRGREALSLLLLSRWAPAGPSYFSLLFLALLHLDTSGHTLTTFARRNYRTCLDIESACYPPSWEGGCSYNRHILLLCTKLNLFSTNMNTAPESQGPSENKN